MDPRWQFIAADLFSNTLVALAACLLGYVIVGPGWPMPLAMLVGMVAGSVVAFVLATAVLMRWFGAMEIMLPTMVAGMIAGMVIGMCRSTDWGVLLDHLLVAAVIGILTTVVIWVVNGRLIGEQPQGEG